MNRFITIVVVCLIRCGGTFAGEVETKPAIVGQLPIVAPSQQPKSSTGYRVGVNRFYPFKMENAAGPFTWQVSGSAVGFREFDKDTTLFGVMEGSDSPDFKPVAAQSIVVWGVMPGTAKITCWGVVDGRAKLLADLEISVGPRGPPDDPKPDPKPVNPTKLKKGFVVVLYDDKFMGKQAAMTIGDTAWKRSLESIPGVLDFRTYDVTLPTADNGAAKKGYLNKAVEFLKDNGVNDWTRPVVLFIGEDAKVADIQFFPIDNKAKAEQQIRGVIG